MLNYKILLLVCSCLFICNVSLAQDIQVKTVDSSQLKPDISILDLLNKHSPFKSKKETSYIEPKFKDYVRTKDKYVYDNKKQYLWVMRDNFLIVTDFKNPQNPSKVIHKAREPFLDIARTDDGCFLHTKSTILRFNNSMKLIQAIPVRGDRSLSKFVISPNIHAYFFSDNVLEIYDLSNSTVTQTNIETTEMIEQMAMLKNYLVLLMANGEIKALKIGI